MSFASGVSSAEQRVALASLALARLLRAEERRRAEREQERALALRLERGERVGVERLLARAARRTRRAGGRSRARARAPRRIPATAPTAFQVRVTLSIGATVRTPSGEPGDRDRAARRRA